MSRTALTFIDVLDDEACTDWLTRVKPVLGLGYPWALSLKSEDVRAARVATRSLRNSPWVVAGLLALTCGLVLARLTGFAAAER